MESSEKLFESYENASDYLVFKILPRFLHPQHEF